MWSLTSQRERRTSGLRIFSHQRKRTFSTQSPQEQTSPAGAVRSEKCHIRTHAAQRAKVAVNYRAGSAQPSVISRHGYCRSARRFRGQLLTRAVQHGSQFIPSAGRVTDVARSRAAERDVPKSLLSAALIPSAGAHPKLNRRLRVRAPVRLRRAPACQQASDAERTQCLRLGSV
jgi:hypothetical protein